MSLQQLNPIHLDGTTHEGGGQLLRIALSLSSLTGIPIHISDIRGKRGPRSAPGKAGDLKAAHLAGTEWLAKATHAETEGMMLKSRELKFRPRFNSNILLNQTPLSCVSSQTETHSPNENLTSVQQSGLLPVPTVWKEIYSDDALVRLESNITLTSPGSIYLILQAILPYILFSVHPHQSTSSPPVPIRLILSGGTHVFNAPSHDYATQVLFPILNTHLSLPLITTNLHAHGWSTGRADLGSCTFDITPLAPGTLVPSFNLHARDRGALTQILVSILASSPLIRTQIRTRTTQVLHRLYGPEIPILFPVDENSGHPKRLYLLLVAVTANNHRLGRDWLFDEKITEDKIPQIVDKLVLKVSRDLDREIRHGGCVDEFMRDQLVVFQAVVQGKAVVEGSETAGRGGDEVNSEDRRSSGLAERARKEGSLHTRTAKWVVEKLVGRVFDGEGC